ncbi:hypothetical protein Lal_00012089 [Lupinus albus]|nr:hypothetical protein Lal_00012089 [Lupinus albus]
MSVRLNYDFVSTLHSTSSATSSSTATSGTSSATTSGNSHLEKRRKSEQGLQLERVYERGEE